jgi:UDP-glucose 4-epimerase
MYLVTGGAGFIGSHLVRRLLAAGQAVRVLDNETTGSFARLADVAGRVELIAGDIRDERTLKRAMRGVTHVLHQAADVSVPKSVADPLYTYAVNVTGTLHVLEAARQAGARRVVIASSSAVYGDNPESPKREEMPPQPISPYASSKLAGEALCSIYTRCYGLETVALRYFNVYGPGQDPTSAYAAAIPRMVDLIQRGQQPVIYGDGEQTRDFVYVGDVAEANLLAAAVPEASGGVFNIATGMAVSLNTILRQLSEALGREVTARYEPERPGDIRHSLADISAAKRVLGFQPSVTFEEGLRRLLETPAVAEGA